MSPRPSTSVIALSTYALLLEAISTKVVHRCLWTGLRRARIAGGQQVTPL